MWQRIRNLIGYLFLFICLFLLSVFFRQPFFVFACLLLLFLPFVSYCISRYVSDRLRITIQSQPREGIKGSRFPLVLSIENPTIFPLLHTETTLHISSPFYENDTQEILILPVLAKNKNTYRFPVTYTKLGCYQIQLLQLTVYDYLHLFRFCVQEGAHAEVWIMPTATDSFEPEDSFYSEGFDEFDEVNGKGFVQNDVSDVREYIPGDRLQKIHWKLSGKLDKLMVKEASAGAMHCFIVLPELYQSGQAQDPDTIDPALENAHAVCCALQRHNEPVFLMIYSIKKEDFVSFQIQTNEDIQLAFTQIFYEKPYRDKQLALDLFRASTPMKGTVIHVTHEGIYHDEA
ncbi:MAG: DUF58 domain-containing protein [Lachnospiraceae bacterium]|nr:DUF58 domain-containing protein [Lachnospiraceae bacterium]